MDKWTDSAIPAAVWSNWIPSSGARSIRRALLDHEREAIERRVLELREGLRSFTASDCSDVDAALHAMIGGYRAMRYERDADADASVEVLRAILIKFPAWAIVEGCLKIARNEAGLDQRFPPNDVQIAGVVAAIVAPYQKTLVGVEALLNAPVEPPEPPRPTREEIEAKLGRPLPDRRPTTETPPDPPPRGDGKHMARVMADLAARRNRPHGANETGEETVSSP